MKSAYLYVRVSTDEQKRKGYSLPEQEDRLLKYCEYNKIVVLGIYREDFSAKDFNRPEWKKLFLQIKNKPYREEKTILFIKWDRFSRNVEYAYEMIGMLRKYRTTAMAIDQPLDFSVPESTVMLAVYLSVPEAENNRRALNTANGIRRAKQMGRYPNKAPLGYINLTLMDGKKIIAKKEPEATIITWVFYQLTKNFTRIEEVRKMAIKKGLVCSRSYFYRLIRNSVYCGLIKVRCSPEAEQMIKGTHEPLISEDLFYKVQKIINTKRKVTAKSDNLEAVFFLRGFLTCPICGRKLTGSVSQGKTKRYPYYHCYERCKTRINANILNDCYQNKLQKLVISNKVIELFKCILEDRNIKTEQERYVYERMLVERKLREEESVLSQARKLFVVEILKIDDYNKSKKEYLANSKCLKRELRDIDVKLKNIDTRSQLLDNKQFIDIFQGFSEMDIADKRHLVSLISPDDVSNLTGNFPLGLSSALSKILSTKHSKKTIQNELHQ